MPRANDKVAWEYRYATPNRQGKVHVLQHRTISNADRGRAALGNLCAQTQHSTPTLALLEPTFDTLLDRFIEEERLLEIKKVRPGESCDNVGELSFSTASSYLSVIKRVRAKWGTTVSLV